MNYTNEILDYLNNPGKLNRLSKFNAAFETNARNFFDKLHKGTNEFFIEACAYLAGKAMEFVISNKLYNIKRIPISFVEIGGGIQINLPLHLQDEIIDFMDGCETALEKYISGDINFDFNMLVINIQLIAESICNKHKIYDYMIGDFANPELLSPQMLYDFVSKQVFPILKEQGYSILQVNPKYVEPVNYVLKKDDITYFVYVGIEIFPRHAKFVKFKEDALKKFAKEHNGIPCIFSVNVVPKDEIAAKYGVVSKTTKVDFRLTEIIEIKEENA